MTDKFIYGLIGLFSIFFAVEITTIYYKGWLFGTMLLFAVFALISGIALDEYNQEKQSIKGSPDGSINASGFNILWFKATRITFIISFLGLLGFAGAYIANLILIKN